MYLHGGEKKEEKEGTRVKNKNTGHVCCSDAFEDAAERKKRLFHHSTAKA